MAKVGWSGGIVLVLTVWFVAGCSAVGVASADGSVADVGLDVGSIDEVDAAPSNDASLDPDGDVVDAGVDDAARDDDAAMGDDVGTDGGVLGDGGLADCPLEDQRWVYLDEDRDGEGGAIEVIACQWLLGVVTSIATSSSDCLDTYPEGLWALGGWSELPGDGIDNDCDHQTDEPDAPRYNWYPDADGDGYGECCRTPVPSYDVLPGHVFTNSDCNDTDPTVSPRTGPRC